MFAKIRLIILYISTAIYLAIFVIVASVSKKRITSGRKWVCDMIIATNRIKYQIVGELNPDAHIIIANHQSFLDMVLVEKLHPKDVSWMAKKELFDLPFFGRAVKIPKMISVNRQNKLGLKTLISDVKDRIDHNRPVAIFPEGTRSRTSNFLSFKSGAQMIANKLDLTVQPIVISNTKSIVDLEKKEVYPGMITLTMLPSFKASQAPKDWLQETKAKMEEVFNDA